MAGLEARLIGLSAQQQRCAVRSVHGLQGVHGVTLGSWTGGLGAIVCGGGRYCHNVATGRARRWPLDVPWQSRARAVGCSFDRGARSTRGGWRVQRYSRGEGRRLCTNVES